MGRRIFNIIVAIPLMLSVVATSNGITFFLHHCHCENTLLVSISEKIICEEDQHYQIVDHRVYGDNTICIDCETESCGCENESITLKLVDVDVNKDISALAGVIFLPLVSRSFLPTTSCTTTIDYSSFETPPPIWGRLLITLFHCAKNPEHIA